MALVILFWAGFLYLADRVVFHGLRLGSFITSIAAIAFLFVVLVIWTVHHLSQPSKQQKEAAQKFYNAVVNKDKPEQ
ncbi:MAG: hypothetical protein IJU38_06795 [Clostridia bacterium]|nr:hypothetical protein [Clostridia bacterium]